MRKFGPNEWEYVEKCERMLHAFKFSNMVEVKLQFGCQFSTSASIMPSSSEAALDRIGQSPEWTVLEQQPVRNLIGAQPIHRVDD